MAMNFSARFQDSSFHNWVLASAALPIAAKGVDNYIETCLRAIQHRIISRHPTVPGCVHNCSKSKPLIRNWCYTCSMWRTEMLSAHRHPGSIQNTDWTRYDSTKWPTDTDEIVRLFLPPRWNASVYSEDITTALFVLDNCKECNVPQHLVRTIRQLRNEHVVHNSSLKISDAHLQDIYQHLNNLLAIPEVCATQDGRIAAGRLQQLQHVDLVTILAKCQLDGLHQSNKQMAESIVEHVQKSLDIIFDESQTQFLAHIGKSVTFHIRPLFLGGIILILVLLFAQTAWISWMFIDRDSSDSDSRPSLPTTAQRGDLSKIPCCGSRIVNVISREDWGARPPKKIESIVTPVRVVFIHHTATGSCKSAQECGIMVRHMQNYHMDGLGWDDLGYSFTVGDDGRVYEGRGWDRNGAHTRGWNSVSVAIAFIGTFTDRLPDPQALDAVRGLLACGVEEGFVSPDYKLYGHRDAVPTLSPGQALYSHIQTWDHYDSQAPAPP